MNFPGTLTAFRAAARPRRVCAALVIAVAMASPRLAALEANAWKYRQPFSVERAGMIKFALPPATLDVAQPGLGDLRLLDASGAQVPFLLDPSRPAAPPALRTPKSFRVELTGSATQLIIETGHAAPLAGVTLVTPASTFLKSAALDVSANGRDWQPVVSGAPLFRQFGAEEFRVAMAPAPAPYVRLTLDDARTRPVPVTGATLAFAAGADAGAVRPLPVRITNREEFAQESVLTLDLGAQHLPLSTLEFVTRAPLFARRVTVAVRELQGDTAVERTLGRGSIYRLAVDDLPPRAQLALTLETTAPGRELLVHIHNGDSPPLAVDAMQAQYRPIWLVFHAPAAGRYVLLTGNPDVAAPHYDLGAIGDSLQQTTATELAFPAPAVNPEYRRTEALADTPLLGATLDPSDWKYRKPVRVAAAGVQQVELDLDVLARTQPEFADLRLLRDGAQVPYVLERPALSRAVDLALVAANDSRQPRLSRWHVKLPRPRLPLTQLTLTSTTALFQRQMRLYEVIDDNRAGSYPRPLATAEWRATPGNGRPLVLTLNTVPTGDTLVLETDNGDNPAIALGAATAVHPVARLLFKSDANPLTLYYGNPRVPPARYDVALVAPQIVAAEKHVATLGPEEQAAEGWAQTALRRARGGVLFWSVLVLVIIVLLVLVARLLPKPPPA